MAYFEWKDQYSVQVARFDAQHQKLIGLMNELFDAMQTGKGKEVLEPILASLVNYTEVHFAAEEQLMHAHGYPDLVKHQAQHAAFTEKVKTFQAQFQSGKVAISVQLSAFLKDWLRDHILKTDQQYSQFFTSHGVH